MMSDEPKRIELKRLSIGDVMNAAIRGEIQEKLHAARGSISEIARRDLMSARFKANAVEIDKWLCAAIAELD